MKRKNYLKTFIVAATVLLASATGAEAQTVLTRTVKPGSGAAVTLEPNKRYNFQKSGSQVTILDFFGGATVGTYAGSTRFVLNEETVTITGVNITSPTANPIYTYPGAEITFNATTTPASASGEIKWATGKFYLNSLSGASNTLIIGSDRNSEFKVTASVGTHTSTRDVRVNTIAAFMKTKYPNTALSQDFFMYGEGSTPSYAWVRSSHGDYLPFKAFYSSNEKSWNGASNIVNTSEYWTEVPNTTGLYNVSSSNPARIEVSQVGGLWRLTMKDTSATPTKITISTKSGVTLWSANFTTLMD